jgi:hypothetical protein
LASKGDNGKSYLSFNVLMARVISLLTVYYNGEVFFRNEPIRNTEVGNAGRIVNTGTSSVNSEFVTALNT